MSALHAQHGTHEQFHAEFKTDLDLTRLPSGKFDTNALVCGLAARAMPNLILQRGPNLHGAGQGLQQASDWLSI